MNGRQTHLLNPHFNIIYCKIYKYCTIKLSTDLVCKVVMYKTTPQKGGEESLFKISERRRENADITRANSSSALAKECLGHLRSRVLLAGREYLAET